MIHSKERTYILDRVKQLDGFKHPIWRTRFRNQVDEDLNLTDKWKYLDGTLDGFVDCLISLNENVRE